jgi:hypothetical protein
MQYFHPKRKIFMLNIIAAIIVTVSSIAFGLWHINRKWRYTNDLDDAFLWSLIPLAIAMWTALYLVGA